MNNAFEFIEPCDRKSLEFIDEFVNDKNRVRSAIRQSKIKLDKNFVAVHRSGYVYRRVVYEQDSLLKLLEIRPSEYGVTIPEFFPITSNHFSDDTREACILLEEFISDEFRDVFNSFYIISRLYAIYLTNTYYIIHQYMSYFLEFLDKTDLLALEEFVTNGKLRQVYIENIDIGEKEFLDYFLTAGPRDSCDLHYIMFSFRSKWGKRFFKSLSPSYVEYMNFKKKYRYFHVPGITSILERNDIVHIKIAKALEPEFINEIRATLLLQS